MTKNKRTIVALSLSLLLFIFFILLNYALYPREYRGQLDFENGALVEVVYDLREGIYFFIESKWLLPNTCLYWTRGGPNFSWGKYDDETFYIYDSSTQPTYVDLTNTFNGGRCTCNNDHGVEYRYCRAVFF
ncbi:hypothetical protein COW94_04670 [Candidatus Peregrinibacteria bacterium CG22_combo_CG10-13_8_21_14_all_44_10]|nr:MAG: hypothetical protein COW94_04670 [Candidatus Peregrinibacteria bacterium CG22_combo_CG10-13_8_21_14_all_44_10]PIS04507.1 MAG: hypothetical protein COT83_00095 [Candidatus Peregrinibacteria bacterium CG10_big_fil_rev_8_21_14_0_10_44_7]PIX80192.1 MAG: hypothetical protein COZ35_01430 [Candidatus Peregrinibacteria bacterium CG_4_10_14_3_um_filter_44_21]